MDPAATGAVLWVSALLFGLLFGSFLNCVAVRTVRGEDWVRGRSHCPRCGHVLAPRDLIPVLSFLSSRGRCRYCGERISLRYPLTELAFAAITVLCTLRFGITAALLRYFTLACCLFVLSLTDIEARLIPNGCIIAALVAWFVTEPWLFRGWPDFGAHVAAMVFFVIAILCLSLIMDRLLKRDSLGGGDLKLIGVLALYLGVIGTMFLLFFASVLGILYAVFIKRLGRGQAIAFGPFLSVAGFALALYGAPLIEWYAGFLY